MAIYADPKVNKNGESVTYWKVPFRDENGKRKFRSFPTKKEAKEFAESGKMVVAQKKAAIRAGADPDAAVALLVINGQLNAATVERVEDRLAGTSMRIRDAIDAFIAACQTHRENHKPVRPQTAQAYREKLYALRDKYGDDRVNTFDKTKAKEYRDHLIGKCSTAKAAKNCLVVAKMLFQWLVDDKEEIKRNPFDTIRIVTGDDSEVVKSVEVEDIYTDEEVTKLMVAAHAEAIGNVYTIERSKDLGVITLMVYCGLRIGEALAMEWDDIDLDDKIVRVKQTLTKKMMINETKTTHGMRRIALHPKAIEYLKLAKARAVGRYVSSVHTPDGDGGPTHYRNMKRSLDRIIKKAGIIRRGPHSLRHYFASKLIDAGYDGIAIKQQMGHSDLSFTVKVYGHLLNKHARVTKDVDRMATVEFG